MIESYVAKIQYVWLIHPTASTTMVFHRIEDVKKLFPGEWKYVPAHGHWERRSAATGVTTTVIRKMIR